MFCHINMSLTFREINYSENKNGSPLWPCCDSSCSQRCTWRSRWPVWSQVTPQKRPPLCWCSVDSADVSSSPCLVFLGSPSRAGRGKGISSQCSPPWTRACCPRTPDSWGSLLRPAGDHNQSSDLVSHSASTQSRHFRIMMRDFLFSVLGCKTFNKGFLRALSVDHKELTGSYCVYTLCVKTSTSREKFFSGFTGQYLQEVSS